MEQFLMDAIRNPQKNVSSHCAAKVSISPNEQSRMKLPQFRGHFPPERKSPICPNLNHPTRQPFAPKCSSWCAAVAPQ